MEAFRIERDEIEAYLKEFAHPDAHILAMQELRGEAAGPAALKQFGYGRPLLVNFVSQGRERKVVFHHIKRNGFGREREDDRVAAVWLDYNTFNRLPGHVHAVDKIVQTRGGALHSIGSADKVLLVTAYAPGQIYADDLVRIRDEGKLQPQDIHRVEVLAAYLAEIHQVTHDDPLLWRRRLRDLIGHGEGIMGIADSYPIDQGIAGEDELIEIEELANRWRWRLKPMSHRLSQVHGDFHPFNILFEVGLDFHVLDRSRGEWGDPADDVSCMTINYIFFSLQRYGRLDGPFNELYDQFWATYLEARSDDELLRVIQPWFAWRALVVASPVWYPTISMDVRNKLLRFARRVLQADVYDYTQVNHYLEDI